MEKNTRPAKKQYDLSAIDDLFKHSISPEELREELIGLAFDYVQCVDDGNTDFVKSNMGTIYVLCCALQKVKELETPS